MAHQVETCSFFGQVPWHGLGNKLDENDVFDINACSLKSGLDWGVDVVDLFDGDGRIAPAKGIQRQTDKRILGVVGPRYRPLQNAEAFQWFQPFLDSKECALHTAGSLCEGEKVWVLAQLQRANAVIVKGDEVAKFLLLSNSHDGKHAVRVGFTPIRVVCANTMAMAHSANLSQLIRFRHSQQLIKNLDEIRDIINVADAEFNATADKLRHLTTRHINGSDLIKYVKVILAVDATLPDDKLPTRTKNTINEIIGLALTGKGNDNAGVRGTWYAAYNGITEYLSYNKGRNPNTRMDALWFGANQTINAKALETALDMAG